MTDHFVETEALIAVMSGDNDEALRLVDTMLPSERREFVEYLDRLRDLTDDTIRCHGCNKPVDTRALVMFGGREIWHRECLDAKASD